MKVLKGQNCRDILSKLDSRNKIDDEEINAVVKAILADVRLRQDEALRDYTKKFDGIWLTDFLVTATERDNALKNVDKELKHSLLAAAKNIEKFHKKQKASSYYCLSGSDIILGQLVKPLKRVGIYVPGGSAAYPSSVLMNAIPAKLAGVKEVVMITPPDSRGKIKDSVLVAAFIAGVDKIFKVGGAQGIAALTFGTESIEQVEKITGPGNIYVTVAKKQVAGRVGIDMLAGPSEIAIIADRTANPRCIAADLISQAEHDEMAAAILVTDWEPLIDQVFEELKMQAELLPRRDIIKRALRDYGVVILTASIAESIKIINEIAPEHLEILTEDPFAVYGSIENAGAIFLGHYSPEPLGDYFAGPNHTLPTCSTARFSSPLSVDDFVKKMSLIYYSKEALLPTKDAIIRLAEEEGLQGHANSLRIRFEEEER